MLQLQEWTDCELPLYRCWTSRGFNWCKVFLDIQNLFLKGGWKVTWLTQANKPMSGPSPDLKFITELLKLLLKIKSNNYLRSSTWNMYYIWFLIHETLCCITHANRLYRNTVMYNFKMVSSSKYVVIFRLFFKTKSFHLLSAGTNCAYPI